MKHFALITPLLAVLLLPGCLTQETVTQNGEVISQDYVIKRPLKDAVERSD